MCSALTSVFAWLRTNEQSLAVWLEGLALVAIFWLELKEYRRQGRERKEQHDEMVAQMAIMQSQADATRDSADAAKEAAEVAKQSTDAFINSERAWILGTPSLKDKLRVGAPYTGFVFIWSFKNVGRTPARLVETDAVSWRVADVKTIPETPKYEGKPVPLNNFLLVPNDSIGFGGLIEPFGDELTREEIDGITGMKLTLIAYGYVTYLDQFGQKHTTRFCHTYMVGGPDSEGFRPYWSAPPAYTECD
jgi:hypothetical protein